MSTETEITVETETPDDTPSVVVVDTGDTGGDSDTVTQTDLDHESRITRIEDALAVFVPAVEQKLSDLDFRISDAQFTANQAVETTLEVADAVAENAEVLAEEVEETSEGESEEEQEDEMPNSKVHSWWRPWFGKS